MSAFFNADEHLGDIQEAALRLAPICTNGIDWSNQGGESRYAQSGKSDVEVVAERAWNLGAAFVEQYYQKVEEASARETSDKAKVKRHFDNKGPELERAAKLREAENA
jgi:hypothetical protein